MTPTVALSAPIRRSDGLDGLINAHAVAEASNCASGSSSTLPGGPPRSPTPSSGAADPVGRLLSVASVHDEVMKIPHVPEHRDGGVWARVQDLRGRAALPTVAPLP